MRRILFLPAAGAPSSIVGTEGVFSKSILISAARCLLMYVVLPLLAPILHLTGSVTAPIIGSVLAIVSMGAITYSMRRFFGSDHKYRWGYAAVGGTIFVFMAVSAGIDINALISR